MPQPLRLPTILIVTDNPSIHFWVKRHLDEHFFILHADTKKKIVDALESTLDFIIIDSEMKILDPIELAKSIYNNTAKLPAPIFLITGKLKKSYRERAKKAGIAEFLNPDLDVEELMERIEAGKKAAHTREKTEGMSRSLSLPHAKDSESKLNKRTFQKKPRDHS